MWPPVPLHRSNSTFFYRQYLFIVPSPQRVIAHRPYLFIVPSPQRGIAYPIAIFDPVWPARRWLPSGCLESASCLRRLEPRPASSRRICFRGPSPSAPLCSCRTLGTAAALPKFALQTGRGLLSARPSSGRILHLTFLYFVITVLLPFLQRQCSPSFPCGYSLPALRLDRGGVNREARRKKIRIAAPDSISRQHGGIWGKKPADLSL